MKTYTFFSDSGHAWMAVPLEELEELDITDKITTCSYMLNDMAYLEEDLDAGTFINALKEQKGRELTNENFKESYQDGDSRIRNYNRYTANYVREELCLYKAGSTGQLSNSTH